MRKILAIALAAVCVLSLTGCGESIEDAAYNAQKKITGIGANNPLGDANKDLNQIVDDFTSGLNQFTQP